MQAKFQQSIDGFQVPDARHSYYSPSSSIYWAQEDKIHFCVCKQYTLTDTYIYSHMHAKPVSIERFEFLFNTFISSSESSQTSYSLTLPLGASKQDKQTGKHKESRGVEGGLHKKQRSLLMTTNFSPSGYFLSASLAQGRALRYREGGGGTWFAGSLAGVAHQTPTGRQSPLPGQRTGRQAGSCAGPPR